MGWDGFGHECRVGKIGYAGVWSSRSPVRVPDADTYINRVGFGLGGQRMGALYSLTYNTAKRHKVQHSKKIQGTTLQKEASGIVDILFEGLGSSSCQRCIPGGYSNKQPVVVSRH